MCYIGIMNIQIGQRYLHYKGNTYAVIGLGRDSETLEEVVVYQGEYDSEEFGNNPVWVRPLKLFSSTVEVEGKTILRFTLL